MKKPRPDKFTRTLAKSEVEEETRTSLLAPSPNPATNLLIADIVVRGASTLFRKGIEKRVAKASYQDEEKAKSLLDGRTMLTTLSLYGASKLAGEGYCSAYAGSFGMETVALRFSARRGPGP